MTPTPPVPAGAAPGLGVWGLLPCILPVSEALAPVPTATQPAWTPRPCAGTGCCNPRPGHSRPQPPRCQVRSGPLTAWQGEAKAVAALGGWWCTYKHPTGPFPAASGVDRGKAPTAPTTHQSRVAQGPPPLGELPNV